MIGEHNNIHRKKPTNTWSELWRFIQPTLGCGRRNVNQNKKFFFWLFLKNILNTKSVLRRRNMELDSYTSENCILQKEETPSHLFMKCSNARRCWQLIGVVLLLATDRGGATTHTNNQYIVVQQICAQLTKPWRIKTAIIMI